MTSSAVHRLADRLVGLVPAKRTLLTAGALLVPALRSRLSYAFFSKLARRGPAMTGLLETNMGISRRLRCQARCEDLMLLYWLFCRKSPSELRAVLHTSRLKVTDDARGH